MDVQRIRIRWQNGNPLLSDVHAAVGGSRHEYRFVPYIYQTGSVLKSIRRYSYDFAEGKANGYSIRNIDVTDFERLFRLR